jgi:hypothetical protein
MDLETGKSQGQDAADRRDAESIVAYLRLATAKTPAERREALADARELKDRRRLAAGAGSYRR